MRAKKRRLIAQAAREGIAERMVVDALTPPPKRPWWRRLLNWILRRRETVPGYSPRRTFQRLKRFYKANRTRFYPKDHGRRVA